MVAVLVNASVKKARHVENALAEANRRILQEGVLLGEFTLSREDYLEVAERGDRGQFYGTPRAKFTVNFPTFALTDTTHFERVLGVATGDGGVLVEPGQREELATTLSSTCDSCGKTPSARTVLWTLEDTAGAVVLHCSKCLKSEFGLNSTALWPYQWTHPLRFHEEAPLSDPAVGEPVESTQALLCLAYHVAKRTGGYRAVTTSNPTRDEVLRLLHCSRAERMENLDILADAEEEDYGKLLERVLKTLPSNSAGGSWASKVREVLQKDYLPLLEVGVACSAVSPLVRGELALEAKMASGRKNPLAHLLSEAP